MSAAFDYEEAYLVQRVYGMEIESQELKLGNLGDYLAWLHAHGDELAALASDGYALINRAKALYDTLPGNEPDVLQLGLGDVAKVMQLIAALKQLFELYKKFQPQG